MSGSMINVRKTLAIIFNSLFIISVQNFSKYFQSKIQFLEKFHHIEGNLLDFNHYLSS